MVAVVVSRHGVLTGKRRDGIPRWTLPGGKVMSGESSAEAVVREVAGECGLTVCAGVELGRRIHPLTGREIVYLACEPVDDTAPRAASPRELVQVCWLRLGEASGGCPTCTNRSASTSSNSCVDGYSPSRRGNAAGGAHRL